MKCLRVFLLVLISDYGDVHGADLSGSTRVKVVISGLFSTAASDIVDGDPATFPIPSLLGGSFAGSFEYYADASGTAEGIRKFPFSATSIDVFSSSGDLIHEIRLPKSANPFMFDGYSIANPFLVGNGSTIFYLGPSWRDQPGHIPRMPTFIAFDLVSDAFSVANTTPPSAAELNAASVGSLFGNGAFVELDDINNPFDTWDLPIVSLSINASEVPEANSLVLMIGAIVSINLKKRGQLNFAKQPSS